MKTMPIGIIVNSIAIVIGGAVGTAVGPRLNEKFKTDLNMVFGVCAMTMGVSSIVLMQNMPAVILAVIVGTILGFVLHLGEKIQHAGLWMGNKMAKILGGGGSQSEDYKSTLVTALVLFCASGTGIYGSMVSGMTGDHSVLLAKSILDLPTALIFACVLGGVASVIALPQFVIFLLLFILSGAVYPLCTDMMINDFKACGGVLLLATGFRMMKIRELPIADMIPAMILVMPFSSLWTNYIQPLVS